MSLHSIFPSECSHSVRLHCVVCPADVLLSPSKWHQMHWSGDKATLTLTHLNKEDEGLYTLRVTTKSGYETYSAYVFVRGEQPRTAHIKYGKGEWTALMQCFSSTVAAP